MSATPRLWLLLLVSIATACASPPPVARPCPSPGGLLDTSRADRVGKGITSTIFGVAAKGLRFTNARTVAPLTLPAHTSIFTGLRPPEHGVRLNGVMASSRQVTVAHRLRKHGYTLPPWSVRLCSIADSGSPRGSTAMTTTSNGIGSGGTPGSGAPANVVVDPAIAWLEHAGTSRPWFLWVHL